MTNEHQRKIAFASGFADGMQHKPFTNPYEDFELRVQYNYGFRTAQERNDSLYQNVRYNEVL